MEPTHSLRTLSAGTLQDSTRSAKPLSASIEASLCNYLGAFDGTKNFVHLRPFFDDLFADNLIHMMDGRAIDKRCFARINQRWLDEGMIASLEDVFFVDDDHAEYTVHWSNGTRSMVTHVVAFVVDGKIVLAKPCAETESVFANMIGECQSTSNVRHPLHQFQRFRRSLAGRLVK